MLLPRVTFVPNSEAGQTAADRRYDENRLLGFYTNVSLIVAVVIGLLIAWFHGGTITASIAAFAGAVGLGGVLGFLFGVPSPRGPANAGGVETSSVTTGDQSVVNVATPPAPPPTPDPTPGGAAQSLHPPGDPALANQTANLQGAPAQKSPGGSHGAAPKTRTSTASGSQSNLEQVADWVTKLLLGGGLTQISTIPPKVWQWSHEVAIGILGDDSNPVLVRANQSFAAGLLVYGFILGFFGGFLITKLQLGKAISG